MTASEILSIGELARRVGVSVRTLRFYEQKKLLLATRGENGRRYFSATQLQRLQQILVLKSIGLPLADIAHLFSEGEIDASQFLDMQIETLTARQAQLDNVLTRLKSVKASLANGTALDIPTLCGLIKTTRMLDMEEQYQDVIKKYYTKDQLDTLAARAPNAKEQQKIEQQWATLMAKVTRLAQEDADPACDEAQAAAKEWSGLINAFTGGDPEIAAALQKMYADQDNRPKKAESRVNPQAAAFIEKAMAMMKG